MPSFQVYAWGDNDHGQQGSGNTAVNRRPILVVGLEGHRVSRVACGSSHSVAWSKSDFPPLSSHEPVVFPVSRDPLGSSYLTSNSPESNTVVTDGPCNEPNAKRQRPSLAKIVLSLNSNFERQQALGHILSALQVRKSLFTLSTETGVDLLSLVACWSWFFFPFTIVLVLYWLIPRSWYLFIQFIQWEQVCFSF